MAKRLIEMTQRDQDAATLPRPQINVRCPLADLERYRRIASELGMSWSEFVRRALDLACGVAEGEE